MKRVFVVAMAMLVTSIAMAQSESVRETGKVQKGYKWFLTARQGATFGNYITERDDCDDGSWVQMELTTTHGYQIFPQLFVGGGLGLAFGYPLGGYENEEWNYSLPIFTEVRYTPIQNMVSPTLGMRLGYVYGFDEYPNPQGAYFNPSVGVRIGFKKHFALDFSLDYILQRQKTVESIVNGGYYWDNDDQKFFSHSIMFGVSLEF